MAIEITDTNFEEIINSTDKPVMLDFWAQWCGPCLAIAPSVEELAKEYDGQAIVGKVDVDSNPKVAITYGVRNFPTILYLKNGKVVDKQVGAAPKSILNKKLQAQIG